MLSPRAVVILVGFACASSGAVAISDDVCLSCHAEESVFSDAGERARALVVTAEALAGSPHEGFSCTQCHADLAADDAPVPHAPQLAAADCGSCHGETVTAMQDSIHALAFEPRAGARSACVSCHGSHGIRPASDPQSVAHPRRVHQMCASCHEPAADGSDPVSQWKHSVHGHAVLDWDVGEAPSCAGCHSPHAIRGSSDPQDPRHKSNQMKICGACHPSELRVVLRGSHGKAWQAGNLAAPVCSDCHGSHTVQRPRERDSKVYAAAMAETCGRCHNNAEVMSAAGLPADRVSSYEDTFHGKAMRWKDENVANCASCHRYHDVRPQSDPASPIHANNLQATCGRCHPSATPTFARMPVHTNTEEASAALLRWVKLGYIGIIAGTLGFMGVHQGLDLYAAFRERRRRRRDGAHAHHPGHATAQATLPPPLSPLSTLEQREGQWVIRRWTRGQVIQHFLLATTFLTLCLTGFALELPAAWAGKFGSWGPTLFQLRSDLHRVAAVLMTATALYHAWWLLFARRGRRELAEMLPRPVEDLRHLRDNILYFVGLRKDPAQGRRYTYREKLEYWALIWGTLVMVATGVVLWTSQRWHWMVVEMSSIVHSYEAILAFGAILLWHLLSVQLRPGMMHRLNPTVVDGTVEAHVMQHEHPQEYREVVAWHGFDPFAPSPPPAETAGSPPHPEATTPRSDRTDKSGH